MVFKPKKAPTDTPESPQDIAKLRWPMWFEPKIDGIRMTNYGKVFSAQAKPFPSNYVHTHFGSKLHLGIDGEATSGEPNDPLVFSNTYSAMMTHGSMAPVIWNVFDYCHPDHWDRSYEARLDTLLEILYSRKTEGLPGEIRVVERTLVKSWDEALEQEQRILLQGYEGGMLHGYGLPYKFGRGTLNQNYLIKLKRFETREAIIIGFYELEHNDNEAYIDGTGHTKRSSHKANKRLGGTLGGFRVRDCVSGVEFNLGSGLGLDAALRHHIWHNQALYLGKMVSYKKLKVGEKDKPRNCTFRGFRSPIDL